MADYRRWTTCSSCGVGQINSFGGGCRVCEDRKRDKYAEAFVALFREDPEEAIRSMAGHIYHANHKR